VLDLYASATVAKYPAQPSNWKYLFGREHHTPSVSGERIANKDCRTIGSAYAHGGRQAASDRENEGEEEEKDADVTTGFPEPEGFPSGLRLVR